MSAHRFKIPRTSDKTIVKVFRQLAKEHNINSATLTALSITDSLTVSFDEHDEILDSILELDSDLIFVFAIAIAGMSIRYDRGGHVAIENKSPIYDEITINISNHVNNMQTNKVKLQVVAFLQSSLNSFENDRVAGGYISKEDSTLLAIHHSTLERLEKLNENLVKQSSEYRNKLDIDYDNKIKELEHGFAEKKELLEAEFHTRENDLNAKSEEIESKLKEIDDRDNTHARRSIRDKMLDDVKVRIDNFGLSNKTSKKRIPVLLGISILFLTLVGLIYGTLQDISAMNTHYASMDSTLKQIMSGEDSYGRWDQNVTKAIMDSTTVKDFYVINLYWLWARFTLLSFGLLGTIIYYIKWENKWAEEHAKSEYDLQQFYIDVNRANWVVETNLEWHRETTSPMPTELINKISNGLFESTNISNIEVLHPADELASALMGSASKLKLKLGDNEMEFDKPSKINNEAIVKSGSKV